MAATLHIQTFGLLEEILYQARAKGEYLVSWDEFDQFIKQLKVPDTKEIAKAWAGDNMMWIEYVTEPSNNKIVSIIFGSSK